MRPHQQPGRAGLISGIFDGCHDGHKRLLRRATSACDQLFVGVHTDERILLHKGALPVYSQLERQLVVKQLGIAEKVVTFTDHETLCDQYGIEQVFLGDDWFWFRQEGRRIGLALGVFDFCHAGHVNLLRQAASKCDLLIVGVHSDDNVVAFKGTRPVNSQLERQLALEELGIADRVLVFTDRGSLCKQFDVDVVFHGDELNIDQYRKRWGDELISDLNIELELLPHTPEVSSATIREQIPPIGWWMYCQEPGWARTHIFEHIRELYRDLGGTWFVSRIGRDLVRKTFPDAACVLIEERITAAQAATVLCKHNLDVIVGAQQNLIALRPVLNAQDSQVNLVILCHGRSGKKGGIADANRRLGAHGEPMREGSLIIHDWSLDPDCYPHLDGFLRAGGSFTNAVPDLNRPRVLILPTWYSGEFRAGLLQGDQWAKAFAHLADQCELLLAPHPMADQRAVQRFLDLSGARLRETAGRSFELIPTANCVVCDLSGVFWESMLFDTPVILATPEFGYSWPDDLRPGCAETAETIPFVQAGELVPTVLKLLDKRVPAQSKLAALRLGHVDGTATANIVKRIKSLLPGHQKRQ